MNNQIDSESPQDVTGAVVRPRLIKKRAPQRFMNMKIGQLRVELWEYLDPNEDSFARLMIEPSLSESGIIKSSEGETERMMVELDMWHAYSLREAIESWIAALARDPRTSGEPYLQAQIASVFLALYRPQPRRIPPKAVLTLNSSGGASQTVKLTDLEACMLSNTLLCLYGAVPVAE